MGAEHGPTGRFGEPRPGSDGGEPRIALVELLRDDGELAYALPAGGALAVALRIDPKAERVEDPIATVVIRRASDGEPVLDLRSDSDGEDIGPLDSLSEVRLELGRLDLAPGEYVIDVGLEDPVSGRVYDHRDEACTLRVSGRAGARAPLSPPRRWAVERFGRPKAPTDGAPGA